MELKMKANIKFLGVLLDKNLTWKDHTSSIEKKISKNIGLIFRAKNVLNKDSLTKRLYNSYIHCYLNYASMAWVSTYKTNLRKTPFKQKVAIRLICSENKPMHTKPLMQSLQVVNNKHSKTTVFMHSIKTCSDVCTKYFCKQICPSFRQIPKKFLEKQLHITQITVTKQNIRYLLGVLPSLLNKVLSSTEKELQEPYSFKACFCHFFYFTKRKHFKHYEKYFYFL